MKPWVRISANLPLAAGEVWAAITWVWGSRWEILEQTGPPEYAALIVVCTGGLVSLNWPYIKRFWSWINRLRPSVRFRELADEIETVLLETPEDTSHRTGRTMLENRVFLARKLNRLKIETPPNPGYGGCWLSYLEKLHLYARLGNIDAARKLWTNEQEPRLHWKWWDE